MNLGVAEEEGLFYGLLMGAVSVGIIIASLLVGAITKIKNIKMRKIMLYSGMLHALVFSLIGIPNNFLLVYIIIIISGLACTPFMIYEYTLIQRESPKDKLGRVYSLSSLVSNISYSIGAIMTGFILTVVGNVFLMYVYLTTGLMMFVTVIFLGNGLLYNKKEMTEE